MPTDPNPSALDRLAARCAADPFCLASALAAYQRRHGLDDAGFAAALGCAPSVLPRGCAVGPWPASPPGQGAVEEWQEEVRRTGKEPSGQWQKKWQEKWAPIPRAEDLYPAEAIAELREEDRRVGTASKEWRKKWREKWDYPEP